METWGESIGSVVGVARRARHFQHFQLKVPQLTYHGWRLRTPAASFHEKSANSRMGTLAVIPTSTRRPQASSSLPAWRPLRAALEKGRRRP